MFLPNLIQSAIKSYHNSKIISKLLQILIYLYSSHRSCDVAKSVSNLFQQLRCKWQLNKNIIKLKRTKKKLNNTINTIINLTLIFNNIIKNNAELECLDNVKILAEN